MNSEKGHPGGAGIAKEPAVLMSEGQFKAAYIVQFLASYMASRYDQDCLTGHPGEPYNHQPVTDAAFLAECAWQQVVAQADDTRPALATVFALPEAGALPSSPR